MDLGRDCGKSLLVNAPWILVSRAADRADDPGPRVGEKEMAAIRSCHVIGFQTRRILFGSFQGSRSLFMCCNDVSSVRM